MKNVPFCSIIVQINGTIRIFELDFKNQKVVMEHISMKSHSI